MLANERTLLAYIRTCLGLFAAGAGLIKLMSESLFFLLPGYIFVVMAPIILVVGLWRYIAERKRLLGYCRHHGDD